MRICLDVSPAIQQSAGIAKYVNSLVQHLQRVDSHNQYTGFYNRNLSDRPLHYIQGLPIRSIGLGNKSWRSLLLVSHQLRWSMDKYFPDIDLLHATDCVFPPLRGAKVVMTVHDLSFLIFPQYHTPLNRLNLRLALPVMIRRADAVIVDSENTRRDLVRLRRVPEEKIHVIPLGVGERYQPVKAGQALPVLAARYRIRGPYLLFVGTLEPRKNLIGLLEVYENLKEALNCQLVIVGKQGWHSESFYSRLKASSACDKVILTGAVPEADLPLLYSSALLFVYPSFYEGFGLPVLEAMACGVPVVCSNTSSLPEVVGESAVLVDPSDVRLLAEAIRRVIENKQLRIEMRAKGLEKARQFTWERTARSTLAVYHKVLSAGNA